MNIINEYDQIRKMLSIVREISEDQPIELTPDQDSSAGDKVEFDDINTIGFYNSDDVSDDNIKRMVVSTVGEFIKSTGLILNVVNINVSDGRVILVSDTIKNPGVNNIKQIKIDTESESPEIEVLRGTISLTDEFTVLMQNIIKSYNDNQIGRQKLVISTQRA